jgi:hypothetical protein
MPIFGLANEGDIHGTILGNAFEGYSVQGVVEQAPRVDGALQKAAINFLPMIAASLRSRP